MQSELRPELTPLPKRMLDLPVVRGYPVPYFVAWIDGIPEFRCVRPESFERAHNDHLCWVCGQKLGRYKVFVLGPMCCVTRTSAELPCHYECAFWSVMNCPFLVRPRMERRDLGDLAGKVHFAGDMIARNPGVMGLWVTLSYELFPDGKGQLLARVGDRVAPIEWYTEARTATKDEVNEAIDSGVVLLADKNPQERADIDRAVRELREQEGL